MECLDGGETSCTVCNNDAGDDYFMIETGSGHGRCVADCPYNYYEFEDPDTNTLYCVKECPEGFGEDIDLQYCFECSEIDNCLDCEKEIGEFATC